MKPSKLQPQPEPAEPITAPAPAAPPEPEQGILASLLDFVLPTTVQIQGSSMGRNARHDLLCVAEHLIEAKSRLKSVAHDASAAGEFAAFGSLNSLIERI